MSLKKLFSRPGREVNIHSVKIAPPQWPSLRTTAEELSWRHPTLPGIISVHFFNSPPDIPPSLVNIIQLRSFYRHSIEEAHGGMLKVEVFSINNIPVVETLFKIPNEPHGLLYIGSMTIPFADCSFVIKAQAAEYGTTGIREAIIADRMMAEKTIEPDEKGNLKGWTKDPYDAEINAGLLMNMSEYEIYDHEFPTHPLTFVRNHIKTAKESIQFEPEIFKLNLF